MQKMYIGSASGNTCVFNREAHLNPQTTGQYHERTKKVKLNYTLGKIQGRLNVSVYTVNL